MTELQSQTIELVRATFRVAGLRQRARRLRFHFEGQLRRTGRLYCATTTKALRNLDHLDRKVSGMAITAAEGLSAIMHTQLTKPMEFQDALATPLAEAIAECVSRKDSVGAAEAALRFLGLDAKVAGVEIYSKQEPT